MILIVSAGMLFDLHTHMWIMLGCNVAVLLLKPFILHRFLPTRSNFMYTFYYITIIKLIKGAMCKIMEDLICTTMFSEVSKDLPK